ncbi:carboxypeptidase regulatory-like domain-containing protein [Nocardioides sp. LHD-245]|uniref:cutinase family protein n=1 Tax=Nocardioides sp. LHD-245 TaxID=3051387 RepID=UPI0027E13216|nr:carboxypeptidase regulatory-like domain-containing protein [Nocardioides sp. LHD-245]
MFAFCVAFGGLTVASAPIAATTGSGSTIGLIAGQVTEEQTGQGLPGIAVDVYHREVAVVDGAEREHWAWSASVETDGSGQYSVELDAGDYRLRFADGGDNSGYLPTWTGGQDLETAATVMVGAGETQTVDVALTAAVSITGTVTDAGATGTAIAGLTVAAWIQDPEEVDGVSRLVWRYAETAATDRDGHYELRVAPGVYRVGVSDDAGRWEPVFFGQQVSVADASSVTVDGAGATGVDMAVDELPAIHGIVTDGSGPEEARPLAGIDVVAYQEVQGHDGPTWLSTRSATTNTDGSYDLYAPAGTYRIGFHDPKGMWRPEYASGADTLTDAADIEVSETGYGDLDAQLAPAAALQGVVRGDGAPLPGIIVVGFAQQHNDQDSTHNDDRVEIVEGRTDAEGRYRLPATPGATYRVGAIDPTGAWADGYYGPSASLDEAADVPVSDQPVTGVDVELAPAQVATVSGIVLHDGLATANVTVTAYRFYPDTENPVWAAVRSAVTGTGTDGRYVLRVPDGLYRFVFAEEDATYLPSWYNDGATMADALDVAVAAPDALAGIDADLVARDSGQPEVLNQTPPSIPTAATVGAELAIDPGQWNPSDATLTFQWYADETPISGATQSSFTPTSEQVGQQLSVLVEASKDGYISAAVASNATSAVVTGATPTDDPTMPSTGPGTPACQNTTDNAMVAAAAVTKAEKKLAKLKKKLRKAKKANQQGKVGKLKKKVKHAKSALTTVRSAQAMTQAQQKSACSNTAKRRSSRMTLPPDTPETWANTTGSTEDQTPAGETTLPDGWISVVQLQHVLSAPCQDIVFVGARGSGEASDSADGFGTRVANVWEGFKTSLSARRVGYYAVTYPAQAVDAIAVDVGDTYFAGLRTGVEDARNFLYHRSRLCPSERYVLSGYSQGAMVVHRVMWDTGLQDTRQLLAVLAIADGDRLAFEGSQNWGTASPSNGITWYPLAGVGRGSRDYARRAAIPDYIRPRFISVCDHGDSVCDPGAMPIDGGMAIHGDHYQNVHDDAWLAGYVAGGWANQNTQPGAPMQITNQTTINAATGLDYETTLGARGGVPPYRFAVTTGRSELGLAGIYVTTSGKLYGRPNAAGTYDFTLQVRDVNGQLAQVAMRLHVEDPPWGSGTSMSQGLPSVNFSGRYIAHRSYEYVNGNVLATIELWDRSTGAVQRISSAIDGGYPNADSWLTTISSDARYIAFASTASNLVAGDEAGTTDIFIWDRYGTGNRLTRMNPGPLPLVDGPARLSMSGSGRYLTYPINQPDPEDPSHSRSQVVRWDRVTGQHVVVSQQCADGYAGGWSGPDAISNDGRYVAYTTGKIIDGGGSVQAICVWDATTGQSTKITSGLNGAELDYPDASRPAISGDGNFVAFESSASNIVEGDDGSSWDVFVWHRADNTFERDPYEDGNWCSPEGPVTATPTISDDGQHVACNGTTLVWDRTEGTIAPIVTPPDGWFAHPTDPGGWTSISGNGSVLAFASTYLEPNTYQPRLYAGISATHTAESRPQN